MTLDRQDQLESIGFSGKVVAATEAWKENLSQLPEFIVEHAQCSVPMSHPICGRWLSRLTTQYHKGIIDPEARSPLELIAGFAWGQSLDDRWDANLAKVNRFKEKHGHCSVPYDHSKQGETLTGKLGLSPKKLQEK